ncbi:MAG: cobalamin B12-binding domain-containing protein [Chloroflexi bacterium]|nr:cobalamin B12-binding domain-containing protein [Chloroflexota bacterium]
MSESENELVHEFEQALLAVDRLTAKRLLAQAHGKLSTLEVVEKVVTPTLERIGLGWQLGSVALSQYYMSGSICEGLVDNILPPADPHRRDDPKMAIAVLDDYHRLGKRIVHSILRASGFEVLDYGHGVKPDELVDRATGDGVEILLISTLMLPSALRVKDVTAGLREAGSGATVVVGGAPFLFDDQLWREVGADAMGKNASEAVEIARGMAGRQR